MFGDRRTYRDLLTNSLEGIATNILGSRLKVLVGQGFLMSETDPAHKQRTVYSLTEKAIALLPAMVALGAWGRQFMSVTPELAIRIQVLEEGGRKIQEVFMDELRERHLGIPNNRTGLLVSTQLQNAFDGLIAMQSNDET